MVESAAPHTLSPQLPLELTLDRDATLENFCPRSVPPGLLDYLQGSPSTLEPVTYIHGTPSTGKSHLLQGLCHRHGGSVYLPLAQLLSLPAGALTQDLERAALVAIDDLQAIAGQGEWEEALFHLINRARTVDCPLIFAAPLPPAEAGIALPDLRSRLAGGVTWALGQHGDDDKRAIVAFRAGRRGLQLSEAVLDYLCSRDSRALQDLLASLDLLDRASLQLQRPITVPLVRETMGW